MEAQGQNHEGGNGHGTTGVIGGGARMLRALLNSPKVAKTVRIALSNLDPEAAPELVRALFFGDTVLFFDLLSAAPELANTAILGAREAASQLRDIPEDLVDRFVPRILSGVDAEALGETVALTGLAAGRLLSRDNAALDEGLTKFERGWVRGFQRGLASDPERSASLPAMAVKGAVDATDRIAGHLEDAMADSEALPSAAQELADGIRRVAKAHPQLMDRLVRPVWAAVSEVLEGES